MRLQLFAMIGGAALASGVALAEPPAPDTKSDDAAKLWDTLSAAKQRVLIKHAPHYVRAADGRLYLTQVEQEQQRVAAIPERGRTEREQAVMFEGAPALFDPGLKRKFESRDAEHTAHCDTVRAEWEARVTAIKKSELDKVDGKYIESMEIVQVLPDGLLVHFGTPGAWEDRLVRLDKYPLNTVVVDHDKLKTEMKVRSIGRYQYTSTIGATKTIERYELVKVFDWDSLLPKLVLPDRSFKPVKPPELALAVMGEGWSGLPEFIIKKVKTSDGKEGGEVLEQRDNGWFTARYVVRRDKAEVQTYEWRWEVRSIPLPD